MTTLRLPRSSALPSVLRCLLSSVAMLLATAGFAQAPDAANKPAEDKAANDKLADDQAARERKFEESMRNVSMVGFFTASDKPAGKLSEDRYVIDKIVKDKGDIWTFHARIQYGKHDTPVRLPVPVKWAGDTPVISVTKMVIPAMGTFNARVLIYDGHYAGTWDGAGHGGQMFGRIEKNKEADKKEGEKKESEEKDSPTSATDQITPIGRANTTGAYGFFLETILGKEGRFREDVATQYSASDVFEAVANSRSAIAYGPIPDAKAGVKVLQLSVTDGKPIALSEKAVRNGDYPLARPHFMYSPKAAGATAHFLAWVRSTEGQEVAKSNGYVPIADPSEPPAGTPPDAKIRISGSDTMVNVGQRWGEAYMKKYPNVQIQISGGGSGLGIARVIDGTTELAASSRLMTPKEKAAATAALGEFEDHTIAYNALAVFVHKDNPIESISFAELADIYGAGGSSDKWSDLFAKRKQIK